MLNFTDRIGRNTLVVLLPAWLIHCWLVGVFTGRSINRRYADKPTHILFIRGWTAGLYVTS